MSVSKRMGAVAVTAAVALVAAGCGGGSDSGKSNVKTEDAIISIDGGQPENPLVPANTTEVNGGKVVDFLWTGLVSYPADGSKPVNAVADSIDTKDGKVYDIKLKSDTKFHDGTTVMAKNFVDAWNWSAYAPNGAANGTFFAQIKGYDAVHPADPDGETGPKKAPAPTAKTMSGLVVKGDYEFQVTLNAPFSIFPTMLGYSAFMPLPDAFFKTTPALFGKKPIGNGPVKFDSWEDNVNIKLSRFDDYKLDGKVKIKGVTVKFYTDETAAYNDLTSGALDFMQQVPTDKLADQQYQKDLGKRFINNPIPASGTLAFPLYDKRFANADLRKAISLSIDRAAITDKIFYGARTPSDSWSNPLTPGYTKGDCTVCKYDPTQAQALLAKAGGFKGSLLLFYNADKGHKDWMEAVAGSIKNTLKIDAKAEGIPTFGVFRTQINNRKMTGLYRAGWQQDYPDVENWIGPLYVTNGSSNDGEYSNPAVDKLYKEGTSAKSVDEAHAKFAEATKLIDADVPSIPIYYNNEQSGYSKRLGSVKTSNVGEIDLASVELK